MKKIFIVLTAFVCVSLFVGFLPQSAKAATIEELQQLISSLLAQVAALQQQLATLKGNQGASWCHTFNTNLRVGDSGQVFGDIHALNYILEKEGLLTGCMLAWDGIDQECGITGFSEKTASAVVAFQQKYKSEILTPSGLKYGTGYVGNATRAKLNKLYGCNTGGHYFCPKEGEKPVVCTGSSGVCVGVKQDDCCAGLTKVPDSSLQSDGTCSTPFRGEATVCTYCGNGVCGTGENSCNCPADCKTNKPITVTTPIPYQTIKSPVLIAGKALAFEGQFNIRIKDNNGVILLNTNTMGASSYGDPQPFSGQFYYNAPTAKDGTIEVFDYSMKDGSEINNVIVPVVFGDYSGSGITGVATYLMTDYFKSYQSDLKSTWEKLLDYKINKIEVGNDEGTCFRFYVYFSIKPASNNGLWMAHGNINSSGWIENASLGFDATKQANGSYVLGQGFTGAPSASCKTNTTKSINLISPNGGETLISGNSGSVIIRWQSTGIDKVDIRLIDYTYSNASSKLIVGNLDAKAGAFYWDAPNVANILDNNFKAGDNFRIVVAKKKTDGTYGVQDQSDGFIYIN